MSLYVCRANVFNQIV